MVKGSKARKCSKCGRIIFWTVPDGHLCGIPLAKVKKVYAYRLYKGRYYCMDCHNATKE